MPVNATSATAPRANIMMPTRDQLVTTYGSIIRGRQEAGSLKALKHAPAHADRYPTYDITPKFLMGVKDEAVVIKGELYLKTTAVTRFPAHTSWFKAGPAPLF